MTRVFVLLGCLILAGCASNKGPAQREILPAVDVPTHFLVGRSDGTTEEPGPGGGCRNPMVDPRDGTKIILEHSSSGRGYYRVPASRYGVRPGQLLLLECETGRVIGIVRR